MKTVFKIFELVPREVDTGEILQQTIITLEEYIDSYEKYEDAVTEVERILSYQGENILQIHKVFLADEVDPKWLF